LAVLFSQIMRRNEFYKCHKHVRMNASMTDLYHMSRAVLAIGCEIKGDGGDKIDRRIEDELQARKPAGMLSRRDAVYARPAPDFCRCGIMDAGYIYRVRPTGAPQR
jgi:hypothetical protein